MPTDMPHLEDHPFTEADKLRRSAVDATTEPLRVQLQEAEALLLQLRGICAQHDVEVPAVLDRQLFALLHQLASQRG